MARPVANVKALATNTSTVQTAAPLIGSCSLGEAEVVYCSSETKLRISNVPVCTECSDELLLTDFSAASQARASRSRSNRSKKSASFAGQESVWEPWHSSRGAMRCMWLPKTIWKSGRCGCSGQGGRTEGQSKPMVALLRKPSEYHRVGRIATLHLIPPDSSVAEGLKLNNASTTSAGRTCSASCGCCPGAQVPVATTLQLLTATGVDWTVTLYIGVDDYSLRHSLQPRSEFQEAHQSDISQCHRFPF